MVVSQEKENSLRLFLVQIIVKSFINLLYLNYLLFMSFVLQNLLKIHIKIFYLIHLTIFIKFQFHNQKLYLCLARNFVVYFQLYNQIYSQLNSLLKFCPILVYLIQFRALEHFHFKDFIFISMTFKKLKLQEFLNLKLNFKLLVLYLAILFKDFYHLMKVMDQKQLLVSMVQIIQFYFKFFFNL